MSEPELKLCPFCGQQHTVEPVRDYNWGMCDTITCNSLVVMQAFTQTLREAMVTKWNSRPIEDGLRKEITDLKSKLALADVGLAIAQEDYKTYEQDIVELEQARHKIQELAAAVDAERAKQAELHVRFSNALKTEEDRCKELNAELDQERQAREDCEEKFSTELDKFQDTMLAMITRVIGPPKVVPVMINGVEYKALAGPIQRLKELVEESAAKDRRIAGLEKELAEARQEIAEHDQLMKLQHRRTIEADKRYQKAHGTNSFPDLGELIGWLMEQADEKAKDGDPLA